MQLIVRVSLLCAFSCTVACGNSSSQPSSASTTPAASTQSETPAEPERTETIANPASTHCIDHGGYIRMRDTAAGQTGDCVFPNGSVCEEWTYFRDECQPH